MVHAHLVAHEFVEEVEPASAGTDDIRCLFLRIGPSKVAEAAGISKERVRICSCLFPSFMLTSVTEDSRPSNWVGKKLLWKVMLLMASPLKGYISVFM